MNCHTRLFTCTQFKRLHSFIVFQQKDDCMLNSTFGDDRKPLVLHTIQYFEVYNFGSVDMVQCQYFRDSL